MAVSYQVFARKYRPLTFKDVLGQDHVVHTLTNAIKQNRLAHAYLFVGPRGTGKTSTARIFAKALNCSNGPRVDFDPNEDICQEIAEGRSLDVLEIDGASNRGIDHIRDLRDNVRFAPARGTYRIVYIDEVHMLTKESFNALLKTLEEPPPHVKFIFATTEPHKILPTILSRCQRFDLRPIPVDLIANHLLHIALQEGVSLSKEAAYAVAKAADGGMRDAQSMLDQLVSFCGNSINEQQTLDIFGITSRETVAQTLILILQKNLSALLSIVNEQANNGRDMGQLLAEIISSSREALVSKVDVSAQFISIPESHRSELQTLLEQTKTDKILRLIEVLSETEEKMRWSSHKKLHLEIGLIKAVHSLSEANISDIIRALNGAPLPETSITQETALPPQPVQPAKEKQTETAPNIDNATGNTEPLLPSKKETPSIQHHTEEIKPASSGQPIEAKSNNTLPAHPPLQNASLPDLSGQITPDQRKDHPPATSASKFSPPASEISQPESNHVFSALSDTPVRLPETPEITDEDQTDNLLKEDTLTGSLFGEEEIVADSQNTESHSQLNLQFWTELLNDLSEQFPLKSEFLKNVHFLKHVSNSFYLGIHPSDILARDTLLHPEVKNEIEKKLSIKSGLSTTLMVEFDPSLPEPAEEELEPLPPPITQKIEEKKEEVQKKSPREENIPSQQAEETDNSFFDDPFVQKALNTFKARIISQ